MFWLVYCARTTNRRGKTWIRNSQYGPRLLRNLLYICCVSDGFGTDYGFKFLKHIESKTSQYEIWKSLARLNTQFKVKESFKVGTCKATNRSDMSRGQVASCGMVNTCKTLCRSDLSHKIKPVWFCATDPCDSSSLLWFHTCNSTISPSFCLTWACSLSIIAVPAPMIPREMPSITLVPLLCRPSVLWGEASGTSTYKDQDQRTMDANCALTTELLR